MGLILSKTAGSVSNVLHTIGEWSFPALSALGIGMSLGMGDSFGAIAGDQAGFYLGDKLVSKALGRFKFPGKGLVSAVGGMLVGMPLSSIAHNWMDKHMPIGHLPLKKWFPPKQQTLPQVTNINSRGYNNYG